MRGPWSDVPALLAHGTPLALEVDPHGTLTAHAALADGAPGLDEEALASLLAANAPGHLRLGTVRGIDGSTGRVVLFRRFEDSAAWPRPALAAALASLAADAAGQAAPAEAPGALLPQAADPDDVFLQAWREFAHASGLEAGAESPVVLDCGIGTPVAVELLPESGRVVVKALLSVLPTDTDDDEPLLRGLLEDHALGIATEGAVFALDEQESELIVWREIGLESLTGERLRKEVERVAAAAWGWSQARGFPLPAFDLS